jgi:hypothetical protein
MKLYGERTLHDCVEASIPAILAKIALLDPQSLDEKVSLIK